MVSAVISDALTPATSVSPAASPPAAGAGARVAGRRLYGSRRTSGAGSRTGPGSRWSRPSGRNRRRRPGSARVRTGAARSADTSSPLSSSLSEGSGILPGVTNPTGAKLHFILMITVGSFTDLYILYYYLI